MLKLIALNYNVKLNGYSQWLNINVHIRDCHVAGCAIFSILIVIFILLVLYRALSTLDATKRPL